MRRLPRPQAARHPEHGWRAMRSIGAMGVRLTTVHASGDARCWQLRWRGRRRLRRPRCHRLTSLDRPALSGSSGRRRYRRRRCRAAARRARRIQPGKGRGLRMGMKRGWLDPPGSAGLWKFWSPQSGCPGDSAGDQSRVVTPEAAVAAGADLSGGRTDGHRRARPQRSHGLGDRRYRRSDSAGD